MPILGEACRDLTSRSPLTSEVSFALTSQPGRPALAMRSGRRRARRQPGACSANASLPRCWPSSSRKRSGQRRRRQAAARCSLARRRARRPTAVRGHRPAAAREDLPGPPPSAASWASAPPASSVPPRMLRLSEPAHPHPMRRPRRQDRSRATRVEGRRRRTPGSTHHEC